MDDAGFQVPSGWLLSTAPTNCVRDVLMLVRASHAGSLDKHPLSI